jgi:hypothetical protein
MFLISLPGICPAQEVPQLPQLPQGPGPLRVAEVVTWNDNGLRDRNGRTPDWIEISNISGQTVELAGYGLSDSRNGPAEWNFAGGTLAPGANVIVFASGAPDQSTASEHHSSFRLGAGGDFVRVTGPDGVLNDAVEVFAVTLPDVSQGRPIDASDAWLYFDQPTPGKDNAPASLGFTTISAPVTFSHEAGSHAEPFALTLAGTVGEEVRFTLDGGVPDLQSALHTAPLDVHDRSPERNGISMIDGTSTANQHTNGWFPPRSLVPKATTVRARSYKEGQLPGPVSTRTFFVGLDPAAMWGLPVISLTTPADGLFDYNTGIYMLGKVFDDYRAAHPGEALTGHTPANYTQRGDAWERLGSFEFFDSDGHPAVRQNVLLDIQGQSSRSFRQKSFGLKPRGELQPSDAFEYPLFPGLQRRGLGGERRTFTGLRLRNSGNDWDYTMFRDALCHRLVATTGIDVMTPRPVVVFLNGEFWGLYQMQEQGDLESVAEHYGIAEEELTLAEADGSFKEGNSSGVASYRTLRRLVDRGDLSDPNVFAEVSALMDVDNFLRYQLAEIYLGNADWPHNNIRYWRGPAPEPDAVDVLPGHDGRWRWMLFDTDLAYGHPWSGGVADATLAAAISPNGRPGLNAPWSTALLRGLLENPNFRNDFINSMACYLNADFSAARARSLLAEMRAAIEPVMPEQLSRWRTSNSSTSVWNTNVRVMEGFARQRPASVRQQFVRELGLEGTAKLTVDVLPPRAGVVTVHRLRLDIATAGVEAPVYPWQGTFFEGVAIAMTAEPRPGFRFTGWEENGEGNSAPTLTTTLTADAVFHAHFERDEGVTTAPLAEIEEFRFDQWNADAPAGTQPAYLRFEQSSAAKPDPGALLDSVWSGSYALTDRSRFVGLDAAGVGLKDTGRLADFPGSGVPAAVVLALDTRGVTEVTVAWTAATIVPGETPYAIRLQIAVGDAAFTDVLDASGNPVEYLSETATGETRFPPLALPAIANGQPHVELRWRYYSTGSYTGSGPMMRLDDIHISARVGNGSGNDPGQITHVEWLQSGKLSLRFLGAPFLTHTLQWSEDLQAWSDGDTFTTDATGSAQLEIPEPAQGTRALYLRSRRRAD